MEGIVLGYYSSSNQGNLCMLHGLFEFLPNLDKVFLVSLFPKSEEHILKKNSLDRKVSVISFFNFFKILKLLLGPCKKFFLFGDSLTGRYGAMSRLFCFVSLLPTIIFKDFTILPTTLSADSSGIPFLKFFLKRIYKIYLREKFEFRKVRRINRNSELANDLSFLYLKKISKKMREVKKRKLVSVVIGTSTHRLLGLSEDFFVNMIAKQIESFLRKRNDYSVALLPFQYGVGSKNDDRRILSKIKSKVSSKVKLSFVKDHLSLFDTAKIVKKSSILFSTRFHPCVFAYALRTKLITIGTDDRIAYFAKGKGKLLSRNDLENLSLHISNLLN